MTPTATSERSAMRRWHLRMITAGTLCAGAFGVNAFGVGVLGVGTAGACGLVQLTACPAQVAQLAPPTDYRSGQLGPQDRRVQVASDQWPWSAIGRINVVFGPTYRKFCTGTVIGPRQVATAAHCLFNDRVNAWGRPESVHFVLGQTGEKFASHSVAESFAVAPQFKFQLEVRPRYDFIPFAMVKHDWAILTLRDAVDVKPVSIRPIHNAELPAAGSSDEIAHAGYGSDHQYVLSVHKGCTAKIDWPDTGTITHTCDSAPGESGGPLLVLRDGDAVLIGIQSADSHRFESQVGYQALAGHAVSASQFAGAAAGPGHP
jgi:protease YdgD